MSLDKRFTDKEIFLLTNTPFAIGSAMVLAEGSGLGTVKELFANTKSFVSGAKNYPNNEIIVGILPNMENFSETTKEAKELQKGYEKWVKDNHIDSFDKMEAKVLEDSRKVAAILKEKATPQEAMEYDEWAMSIATNVAEAAKEGGFLGIGGERVSENEKAFYDQVAKALGNASSVA
jgi:hypothetical protein